MFISVVQTKPKLTRRSHYVVSSITVTQTDTLEPINNSIHLALFIQFPRKLSFFFNELQT